MKISFPSFSNLFVYIQTKVKLSKRTWVDSLNMQFEIFPHRQIAQSTYAQTQIDNKLDLSFIDRVG